MNASLHSPVETPATPDAPPGRGPSARARLAPWIAPLVGGFLGCVQMTSFDLPLMLACGDRLFRGEGIPRTNPFHWPHPDFPWLDDKWGFGLLCAAAERVSGVAGPTLLNVLLGAVAGWLLYALARAPSAPDAAPRTADRPDAAPALGIAPWHAAGLATAGVALLSYRLMLRAEWISFLGVAWTLLHLRGVLAGSARSALLTVAAVPIWAACHVWWFLGGVLLLAAGGAARSVRTLAWGAAALAAGAISPYGFENLVHPVRIATTTSSFEGAITELRWPFVGGPFTLFHLLAILLAAQTAVWGIAALRGGRRAAAVVAGVLVLLAFRYDRNLALVAPAFVFAAPRSRDGAGGRVVTWPGWLAAPAVLGLAAGLGWCAPEKRLGVGWDERAFPGPPSPKTLGPGTWSKQWINDFSIGSWLDRAHGSSFIDGNTHGWPAEHFAFYRKALEGTATVAEVDAKFPNDGWFLRTSAPHTRVLVVGLLLEGDYAPTMTFRGVATLFRKVADPEKADALWMEWLRDEYLPAARDWFPSPDELLGAASGMPPVEELAARRALVVACPWHRPFVDALRESLDRTGQPGPAARMWRVARRIPE